MVPFFCWQAAEKGPCDSHSRALFSKNGLKRRSSPLKEKKKKGVPPSHFFPMETSEEAEVQRQYFTASEPALRAAEDAGWGPDSVGNTRTLAHDSTGSMGWGVLMMRMVDLSRVMQDALFFLLFLPKSKLRSLHRWKRPAPVAPRSALPRLASSQCAELQRWALVPLIRLTQNRPSYFLFPALSCKMTSGPIGLSGERRLQA